MSGGDSHDDPRPREPIEPSERGRGLEQYFQRSDSEDSIAGEYAAAVPTDEAPPPPEWNLPAATQQSVEMAVSAGYEIAPQPGYISEAE